MRRLLFSLIIISVGVSSMAQTSKRSLTWDDVEAWRRITETVVSRDGNYIAYKTEPWTGDTRVKVYDRRGNRMGEWWYGNGLRFTHDSDHLLFTIRPSYDTLRALRQQGSGRNQRPPDTLAIWSPDGTVEKIARIRGFSLPSGWGGWMAYQVNPAPRERNDDEPEKRESSSNGYHLNLRNFGTGQTTTIPFVTSYQLASDEPFGYFVTTGDDNGFEPGLYIFDFDREEIIPVKRGEGRVRQISFNGDASSIAFLFNDDEDDNLSNNYSLWYASRGDEAAMVLDRDRANAPEGWVISPNGRVYFSENGSRLFYGTAPATRQRDTARLDEDYPNVDVWHWDEGVLHTQQVINRNRDARATYLAVYHIDNGKAVQLATPVVPSVSTIRRGNHDVAIGTSNLPYQVETMWGPRPGRADIYFIDINSGDRELVKEGFRARMQSSPSGKYLYWYKYTDSSYHAMNLESREEFVITTPETVMVTSETSDTPNPPGSYGIAGWLEDEEALLLYDRFDIWRVDPENRRAPTRITTNGRENSTVYRILGFSRSGDYIDASETMYLSGNNIVSRGQGYYSLRFSRPGAPREIFAGDFSLSRLRKAADANTVVFAMETFEMFPDLHVTDLSFRNRVRISDANPQQEEFIWGTVELVSFISLDGLEVDGLLYKPEDFDPEKQYPMIVNFYEKSSQGLHNYRTPEIHRSTIDYHYYTSNGYIIFNPDIHYREGYPGESAYNCVMPGVTRVLDMGFVDPDRVGAQGHSWGGYQVAYMATRTDLFAAIESGAPVVNMISAYGGIRWQTGLNRAFQYENTQSRIGYSIWESPLRYFENSPIFTMDKVNTPILIMHNDRDGHVPFEQGIEYFIALRRLGKPTWLLNYPGEPHWPTRMANKRDFQIRMEQFFNHYLKGAPMPRWMREGRPAIDKEFELGYELY